MLPLLDRTDLSGCEFRHYISKFEGDKISFYLYNFDRKLNLSLWCCSIPQKKIVLQVTRNITSILIWLFFSRRPLLNPVTATHVPSIMTVLAVMASAIGLSFIKGFTALHGRYGCVHLLRHDIFSSENRLIWMPRISKYTLGLHSTKSQPQRRPILYQPW